MRRIRKILFLAVGIALFLVLLISTAWFVADSRNFQIAGRLVSRVDTAERVVALTFDDGPTAAAVTALLPTLRQEGVRSTFFVMGSELAANPDLGRQLLADGHELGNHSWSHRRMVMKSTSFIRREIEGTDSLIRAIGQHGSIPFRPPYGKKLVGLPLFLSRTGRTTVMWDVEPDSYPPIASSADSIVAFVLREVRPGSIIILHVMYPSRRESLAAVPGVIRGLRERGYRFMTVSELIESTVGS